MKGVPSADVRRRGTIPLSHGSAAGSSRGVDAENRREIAYWQHLLTRISEDLESAAGRARDANRRSWLSARAMRIRQRLHEGVPSSFTIGSVQRMNSTTG